MDKHPTNIVVDREEISSKAEVASARHFSVSLMIRSGWAWWMRFTGPPARLFGSGVIEQEKLRRSNLQSALLPLILIGIISTAPDVVVQPLLWLPIIIMGLCGGCIILCNRRGQITAAGILSIACVDIALAGVFVIQPHGLTNSNMPDFDLFVISILLAGLLLPRQHLPMVALSQILLISMLFAFLPHDPALDLEILHHYDGQGFFALQDAFLLEICATAVAWLSAWSVYKALLRADRADELDQMVKQQHVLLEEVNRLYAEQAHAAETDAITDLPNHRAIMQRIDEEVDLCRHVLGSCAVIFVDLDHFKQINDTWGHRAGDSVLHEVGRRLRGVLSKEDVVGRYGGEEFAILLKGTDLRSASRTAEHIRQALATTPHLLHIEQMPEEVRLRITGSIGIAVYGMHGATTAELIEHADSAMYKAKQRGRNCVCIAGEPEDNASKHAGSQEGRAADAGCGQTFAR